MSASLRIRGNLPTGICRSRKSESARDMRRIFAVAAAFLLTAALFQLAQLILLVSMYGMPLGSAVMTPGVSYYLLNYVVSFFAAMAGGWLLVRLAQSGLGVALLLGIMLAAVAVYGFSRPPSQWPSWYGPVLGIVLIAGVLTGARLTLGRRSRSPAN